MEVIVMTENIGETIRKGVQDFVAFTQVSSVVAQFPYVKFLAGGHNDSRTSSKDRVGIGGIAVFGFSLSVDGVCEARSCVVDDA